MLLLPLVPELAVQGQLVDACGFDAWNVCGLWLGCIEAPAFVAM